MHGHIRCADSPVGPLQRPLTEFFPDANPMAIDLLTKMLKFNPEERITVVQALAHPYLAQLHNPVRQIASVHLSLSLSLRVETCCSNRSDMCFALLLLNRRTNRCVRNRSISISSVNRWI